MSKQNTCAKWHIDLMDATEKGNTTELERLTHVGNLSTASYTDLLQLVSAVIDINLDAIEMESVRIDTKMGILLTALAEQGVITEDTYTKIDEDFKRVDEKLDKLQQDMEENKL